ncbi:MAG: hypothetical protein PVI57_06025 [Gemmatimonadota bacterium]
MESVRSTPGRLLATTLILALAGCAQNFYGSAADYSHSVSRVVGAASLERVVLTSRQGPITVGPGPDDSVRVRLRVGPARGAMGTRRTCRLDPGAPRVAVKVSGSTLTLAAEPDLGSECVADWQLTVPRTMGADLEVVAGDVTVEGVTGGVDVSSRAGTTEVRVAGGPVEVDAGSGRIEVDYLGDGYGAVSARTGVGSVELEIDGRSLAQRRAPGSGDSVTLEGGAANSVDLRADVGNISVRLGGGRFPDATRRLRRSPGARTPTRAPPRTGPRRSGG